MRNLDFVEKRYHIPSFLPLKLALRLREATGIPPIYSKQSIEKKIIFIHIPKAAGSSIGELFLGTDRIGHYPYFIYESYCKEKFDSYFKFSVCRHPESRLESAYNYLLTGGKGKADIATRDYIKRRSSNINEFVISTLSKDFIANNAHFYPQHRFIFDKNQKLKIDKVCKFENLHMDIVDVCKKTKTEFNLQHKNQTNKIESTLNEESRELIKKIYKPDYELLGYE